VETYEKLLAGGERRVHAVLMDYHMPNMNGKVQAQIPMVAVL
jgi:CheY-like chemotaxis protein